VTTSDGWPTPRSDAAAPVCDLVDLKPGDCGRLTLALRVDGLPGYLSLVGRERVDEERGQSEAEARDGDAEGELDELTTATVSSLDPTDPAVPESGGATTGAYTGSLSSLVGLGGSAGDCPSTATGRRASTTASSTTPSSERSPAGAPTTSASSGRCRRGVDSGIASDAFAFDLGVYGVQCGGG
jgi:hypothetical protein